ncbi:MAG TPA: hypothetical protein VNF49_09220 [Candidatus Binataceae bacterium]|nr:hypothetical protein [Candidatus Binataceae bacterium]
MSNDAVHGRSLLRSAPALVLFAIVIADAMRGADTDLWSHIYFGRVVLSQHQFLFHAPGSYACPPGPTNWPNLEWLGGVVLAFVYDAVGVVGLKLAKFASVAAMMVLLSLGEAESGASLEVQAVVLVAAAMAFVPQMQFRPVLATYLFFAALMAMLARESYGRRAPLWLAVPMLALWANLHGGFFVGLIAMGLYTAVRGVQDLSEGKGTRGTVRLAALTSAATLATLINPYGLNDWLMIIPYLRNPFTLRYISEFRPLLVVIADFHRNHRPLFTFGSALAIMAGLFVAFALTPRADDLALFAIAALMTATALYAVRNTALAVIACSIPLCRHADLLLDRLRLERTAGVGRPLRIWRVLHVLLVGVAVGIALRTGLLSKTLPAVEVKPVGALAFMQKHDLHGNVLCEYGWAGYFIWHDAPRSRVFMESLFEAYYPHRVQSDFAAVFYAEPGAARVLDAYPNDFVLMPTGSAAYSLMMAQTGWRLIYRDPVSALFARAGSPAARIAGVPQLVRSAPPSVFP